tara:strand:- start:2655 stop:3878 length:1224 start_codon:yes stop_codon:yes gene_type:complete
VSRVDELIAELAPAGIRFATLGDVGTFIRGNGLQKSDLTDEGAPAIHYGQVHTRYGAWADTTVSFTDPALAARLRRAKPGDLIIATTSEDDAAVAKATAWLGDAEVAVSGDAYIYRHNLDPRYAALFFSTEHFQRQKKRHITGTKVRRISGDSLAKLVIPVPPIAVQRAIANELADFMQLEHALRDALMAEAAARGKQRTHYRDELLTKIGTYTHARLDEVAAFYNAKAHEKLVDPQGTVALLTSRFISTDGKIARYVRTADVLTPALKDDVALVMSDLPNGRALARTFFVEADGRYAANQRVCLLRARDHAVVLPRFLFHVLNRNPGLLAYDNGMDQTHLKKGYIQDLRIGVPPLAEQRHLVESLDTLDALFNELSTVTLPAELLHRRKQYEFYRDRLFSFPEVAA